MKTEMTGRDFYYAADDLSCKSIGGAIKAGETVDFCVKISRKFFAYNVYMAISGGTDEKLRLCWKGFFKGFDIYGAAFHAKTPGLYRYRFEIDTFGRLYTAGRGAGLLSEIGSKENFRFIVYEDFSVPEWFSGKIMYQIFPDRFYRGKDTPVKPYAVMHEKWEGQPHYLPDSEGNYSRDFFGGNLSGITQKLDYLKSLGVSCIYLNPIFEAYSNHKYDTADYTKIDSMFGNLGDFEELIQKAGEKGIKIILDGVFNHTGSDSVYFGKKGNYGKKGAYNSKDSKYFEWYSFRHYPDDYECWWGVKTLPQIKKDSESFQEFIAGENGILKQWLSTGIGGIRIDVADELSNNFLKKINRRCESFSDIMVIGEVWEDASYKIAYGELKEYFWGRELKSVMNYPLKYAITDFILLKKSETLSETLKTQWEYYPRKVCLVLMNILSTHDTARILTILSGIRIPAEKSEAAGIKMLPEEREIAVKRLKAASLLQYTVFGVPCLFYGDEAGLEGAFDPFNRKPFPWDNIDSEIYDWYKFLGEMRGKYGVFSSGGFREIYSGYGVYIFERYNESESAVIACSQSDKPFSFKIKGFYDLITKDNCDIINLSKGGFKILVNKIK